MNIPKKILLVLISMFLIYQSRNLIGNIIASEPNNIGGFGNLVFLAFLLNLYITGVFAFPGFVFPTARLLPHSFYRIKHPNRINRMYNLLGVRYFKVLLLILFWGKKGNKKKYFNGNRGGFENFIYQTKQSEFGHFAAFVSILIVGLILFVNGHSTLAMLVMLINIIGNFYPIVLQRHHRARIERIYQAR